MTELRKVNSLQLYYLWRNFAVTLLSMAGTIALTHMLPHYMAPVVSLFFCAVLYTMIWNNEGTEQPGCMIVLQMMFHSLLIYTFLNIILVLLYEFRVVTLAPELNFFNDPFMASLTLLPIAFITTVFSIFFKHSTHVCRNCIARFGSIRDRGYYGYLTSKESQLQLKNLAVLFGALSIYIWWYYVDRYIDINQNGRDWYVFVWIIILMSILDEMYFIMRYYNLYLDYKEHDELITPEEIHDMTARTYLRFYLVCGEHVFIDRNAYDRVTQKSDIYDTPFITKKIVNGIPMNDVVKIIRKMSGETEGELKFFYGRHLASNRKVSVLRYFYFLDGVPKDYMHMDAPGEWVHFDRIKRIYQDTPERIGSNALNDLSRLFTIMLTSKIFDENGIRRNMIKSYRPDVTLTDVRKTDIDLQDDKWIRISQFNSDMKFFKLKKFMRDFTGRNGNRSAHGKNVEDL